VNTRNEGARGNVAISGHSGEAILQFQPPPYLFFMAFYAVWAFYAFYAGVVLTPCVKGVGTGITLLLLALLLLKSIMHNL
jgi:hypothetical protein